MMHATGRMEKGSSFDLGAHFSPKCCDCFSFSPHKSIFYASILFSTMGVPFSDL